MITQIPKLRPLNSVVFGRFGQKRFIVYTGIYQQLVLKTQLSRSLRTQLESPLVLSSLVVRGVVEAGIGKTLRDFRNDA